MIRDLDESPEEVSHCSTIGDSRLGEAPEWELRELVAARANPFTDKQAQAGSPRDMAARELERRRKLDA